MIKKNYNYWKWRILLATMACYLFYYCGRFNLSICASSIAEEFGFSNTDLGFLMSTLIITYGIGQFINGNLGDRFGRVLMPIGAVVSCLFNWLFSYAPLAGKPLAAAMGISSVSTVIFSTLTIAWGANGYFQAMGVAPGGRLISNWWTQKERGRAMGLYTGAAASSNVTIFLLASWIAGEYGWRMAFRVPSLLMALVAVVFYFVTKDHPEDVGLEAHQDAGSARHGHSIRQYGEVLKNRSFMLACTSLGLHHITRWALLSFLPKFFTDMAGWNVKQAGFMSTALPLGMVAGAVSGGFISDKFFSGKRKQLIFISIILCSIATVSIPYLSFGADVRLAAETVQVLSAVQKGIVVAILLLAGYFLYVSIGLYFALCPDLLGVRNSGTGIGIMDAIAYGFAAAGVAIVGKLVDLYGYYSAFWFMAICAVLAGACIWFIKEKEDGYVPNR